MESHRIARAALLCLCTGALLIPACKDEILASYTCGDGVCSAEEDEVNCATDCGPDCGDGQCEPGETTAGCPEDCARLEFIVLDNAGSDESPIALAQATIAIDRPGAGREELTTDQDGKATIEDIDWSAGTITVTAHMPGYNMISAVGVDASDVAEWDDWVDGALPFRLSTLEPVPTLMATVSGYATGLQAPDHGFSVQALQVPDSGRPYCQGNGWYSLELTRDRPFTLLALAHRFGTLTSGQGHYMDYYAAIALEYDPVSVGLTDQNLDFGVDPLLEPHRVNTSMVLPTRPDSPLRSGWPGWYVHDGTNPHDIGWPEYVDISSDGNSFDIQGLWLQPPGVTEPWTEYRVVNQETAAVSFAREPGYPQAGVLTPPLMDVPRWITPADPLSPHPLHSALQWEIFDDGNRVHVYIDNEGQVVWVLGVFDSVTSVTIPTMPSSVDKAALLGDSPSARVEVLRFLDGFDQAHRSARTISVPLAP